MRRILGFVVAGIAISLIGILLLILLFLLLPNHMMYGIGLIVFGGVYLTVIIFICTGLIIDHIDHINHTCIGGNAEDNISDIKGEDD